MWWPRFNQKCSKGNLLCCCFKTKLLEKHWILSTKSLVIPPRAEEPERNFVGRSCSRTFSTVSGSYFENGSCGKWFFPENVWGWGFAAGDETSEAQDEWKLGCCTFTPEPKFGPGYIRFRSHGAEETWPRLLRGWLFSIGLCLEYSGCHFFCCIYWPASFLTNEHLLSILILLICFAQLAY